MTKNKNPIVGKSSRNGGHEKTEGRHHTWDDGHLYDTTKNTLQLNVFLLPLPLNESKDDDAKNGVPDFSDDTSWQKYLLALADLAVALNEYYQSKHNNLEYPWISGGDGPVFGIHLSRHHDDNSIDSDARFDDENDDDDIVQENLKEERNDKTRWIPHLRAICRYGVSVADEWFAIDMMFGFLRNHSSHSFSSNLINTKMEQASVVAPTIVAQCWDVEDGQILLIEAAEHLPAWMDQIGPSHCRHRCWIATRTPPTTTPVTSSYTQNIDSSSDRVRLYFIEPPQGHYEHDPSLGLGDALHVLQSEFCHTGREDAKARDRTTGSGRQSSGECLSQQRVTISSERVQQAVSAGISRHRHSSAAAGDLTHDHQPKSNNTTNDKHVAALAVPRSVARLLARRPDLASTACQMFAEQASHYDERVRDIPDPQTYLAGTCHDWVWTKLSLGRTAFAMLRTVTAAPFWTQEDSIFPPFVAADIQVKRLRRVSYVEATPHLRYGLALGVRIVAGLDACLNSVRPTQPPSTLHSLTYKENRILLYWAKITHSISNRIDGQVDQNWLTDAWHAGPNQSPYDLESILRCPVFDPEIKYSLTPLSIPDMDVMNQISKELLRRPNDREDNDYDEVPRSNEVGDEAWLWTLSSTKNEASVQSVNASQHNKALSSTTKASTATDTSTLDEMLHGVQSFVTGQSSLEGIETSKPIEHPSSEKLPPIDPAVVLNLLHTALRSKSAEELLNCLPSERKFADHGDEYFSADDYDLMMPAPEESTEENDDFKEAVDFGADMEMIDVMNLMDNELRSSETMSRAWDIPESGNRPNVEHDTHVLSNLLQSTHAANGGTGPMQNILREMQLQEPHFANDQSDSEQEGTD